MNIEQAIRSTGSAVKAAATYTETAHPDLSSPENAEQLPVEDAHHGDQS
jgi:hypothetical protein